MQQELLQRIFEKAPLFAPKLKSTLASTVGLADDLEAFLRMYEPYLRAHSMTLIELADAYVNICNDMTCARIKFGKTGMYPTHDQNAAIETVYADTEVMTRYMLGLALSQFLWQHHYRLLQFYRAEIG